MFLKKSFHLSNFCLLILLGLIITACNFRYYLPNSINTPHFTQKNDAHVSMSTTFGDLYKGLETQGAYSFANNWFVFSNMMYCKGDTSLESSKKQIIKFYFLGDVGIGKYFAFHKKWVLHGGIGMSGGKVVNQYLNKNAYSDLRINRQFIQIGLSGNFNKWNTSTAYRFSRFDYHKASLAFKLDEIDKKTIENIWSNKPYFLSEFQFSMKRLWFPGFWYQLSFTYAEKSHENIGIMSRLNVSAGACVDIHTIINLTNTHY